MTIPRSELCAALLLSRLTYSLEEALSKTEIYPLLTSKTLFTDSTTVLSWIRSDAIKYKPFVKNKVLEINELHSSNTWSYVSSSNNNAADWLSKGCKRREVDVIVKGPDMLRVPRSKWPRQPDVNVHNQDVINERNSTFGVSVMVVSEPIFDPSIMGSWNKIIRVTSLVLQFTYEIRKRHETPDEIRNGATKYWIRRAQQKLPDLSDKSLNKFLPFRDEENMIRINGI